VVVWLLKRAHRLVLAVLAFAGAAHAQALLPQTMPSTVAAAARTWTIPDLVQVARIQGTAIRGGTAQAAFIVKQPSLAAQRNLYGLYAVDADGRAPPKRLVSAFYMADLAWRPGTNLWSFRADFGKGVQLYTCDDLGRVRLLLSATTAWIGGSEGVRRDQFEGPRNVGVLSYEWSPDGSAFWYSRPLLRSRQDQAKTRAAGVVYDESVIETVLPSTLERAVVLAGSELRLLRVRGHVDQPVVERPATPLDHVSFLVQAGTTRWAGANHILVQTVADGNSGDWVWTLQSYDVRTGRLAEVRAPAKAGVINYGGAPRGILLEQETSGGPRLVTASAEGEVVKDWGPSAPDSRPVLRHAWTTPSGDRVIFQISAPDHYGLDAAPRLGFAAAAGSPKADFEACSFNTTLTWGVCSRETIDRPPELVAVDGRTGAVRVIGRPNARYDRIEPVRTVLAHWTTRYGQQSTGFVSYPRAYVAGLRYPAVVVTHSRDAKNRFAAQEFQWETPIQVLTERGYVVLSVNEPDGEGEAADLTRVGAHALQPRQLQEADGLEPAAALEAAVADLVGQGVVDPKAVGLAGYSRGAELVSVAISQSTTFRAASIGDDNGRIAGDFWSSAYGRKSWSALFGGSPFDPKARSNYEAYSISFRADKVSAAVLQQFTGAGGPGAMELDGLLKAAHIPTELVVYPGEAHIFSAPEHRRSAMERTMDWFDFWLRGRAAEAPDKAGQYQRWTALADQWQATTRR
jgi:dipeptidyl aminopeptidase/acylaminoacyl peptidase